jgi:hypothetical protein
MATEFFFRKISFFYAALLATKAFRGQLPE